MMYLEELKKLYISMKEKSIDIQRFLITHNNIDIDVTYSIRCNPHTLALTSLNKKRVFICFEVKKGFNINCSLDNDSYKKLANLFNTNKNTFKPFLVNEFINQIKKEFPDKVSVNNLPTDPQTILRGRRDIEEADKIYFIGWTHHTNKEFSQENLYKTTLAFGEDAKNYQIRNNASSRWSDIPTGKNTWLPD
ncbi:DUF6037 family protein [Francisella tularensis]|uniref:DUF6037 family protein n=3 Tax=Francisella tularensis TaxID=263 RepID=UPI001C0EA007|nr:DUF6037 family protein [Francisella tularensis]